jgi:hypothetical protein
MKFKELTDEHKEYIAEIFNNNTLPWDTRIDTIKDFVGVSERTVRKWLVKLGLSKSKEPVSPQFETAKKKKIDKNKKRFIVTWGQSDTKPHDRFFGNIEAYAKKINADIHVIAGRYRNPTSLSASKNVKMVESWHSRLEPYLDANRHNLHKYLSILSDIKIQPTAVNPMSGMQGVSGVNSCIFGSPKLQLETIPVLEGNKPKMMMTTGACTVKNYTDTKAGKKGEFHHTLGFVIIEIEDDETFYARQVSADDNGNFIDLIYSVSDGEVNKVTECDGIVWGDVHCGQHDKRVVKETFKLMKKLKPKHVVLHDIFDGYSISHHDMKDPFAQYAKEYHNLNNLGDEVDDMLKFLKDFDIYDNVAIVRSNHDDFLDRWLKNNDWRKQSTPKNNKLYMQYSNILMEQYEQNPSDVKGVIPALINQKFPKFKTLGRSDSYRISGWECGHHGDIGVSGTRGSVQQFRRLNTKVIVGHYHAPERKDGALAVGTTTKLRLGYNKGASKWMHAHVLIYPNGKTQHVIFNEKKNGKLGFTTLF